MWSLKIFAKFTLVRQFNSLTKIIALFFESSLICNKP